MLSSWLIIALMLPVHPSSVNDPALILADSLYNLENYYQSITEYKRFLFLNPPSPQASHALYRIGLAYRIQREWNKAVEALRESIRMSDVDSLKDERRIILATTLLAKGDYSLAQLELLKLAQFSDFNFVRYKALYFQGVASIYSHNWETAKNVFHDFYHNYGHSKQGREIDSLLGEAIHLSYKSVTAGKILSTIIPGAGQIYAGNWKGGINALIVNAITGTLLARTIEQRRYSDALIVFFSLFYRYYSGNRYRAEEDVRRYNKNLNRKHTEKILKALMEEENGN